MAEKQEPTTEDLKFFPDDACGEPSPQPAAATTTALVVITPALKEEEPASAEDAPIETKVVEGEVVETSLPPVPFYKRRIPSPWLISAIIFILAASTIISYFVLPLFVLSATITIVPDERTVTKGLSLELPSLHPLAATTTVFSKTVPATDTIYQEAQVATGTLTFYNAAPYPQTIPSGTLLVSSSGVDIITDDTIIVPEGDFATNGSQSTAARSVNTGSSQNIPAYSVDGACCRENIFVRNTAPFSGGMDARTFKVVARSDIENGASSLIVAALGKAESKLQAQIMPQEDTTTPACNPKITASHKAGDAAISVTVHVVAICNAFAFDRASLNEALAPAFLVAAERSIPAAYSLVGSVNAAITGVTKDSGTYNLNVHASGVFAYTFSATQKAAIESLVAGKTRTQGVVSLLRLKGVRQASITIWPEGEFLPRNDTRITVIIAA